MTASIPDTGLTGRLCRGTPQNCRRGTAMISYRVWRNVIRLIGCITTVLLALARRWVACGGLPAAYPDDGILQADHDKCQAAEDEQHVEQACDQQCTYDSQQGDTLDSHPAAWAVSGYHQPPSWSNIACLGSSAAQVRSDCPDWLFRWSAGLLGAISSKGIFSQSPELAQQTVYIDSSYEVCV